MPALPAVKFCIKCRCCWGDMLPGVRPGGAAIMAPGCCEGRRAGAICPAEPVDCCDELLPCMPFGATCRACLCICVPPIMVSPFVHGADKGLMAFVSAGSEFECARWKSGVVIPAALCVLAIASSIETMWNLPSCVKPPSLVRVERSLRRSRLAPFGRPLNIIRHRERY